MTGFYVAPDKYESVAIWHQKTDDDRCPLEVLNRDYIPHTPEGDALWALISAAVEACRQMPSETVQRLQAVVEAEAEAAHDVGSDDDNRLLYVGVAVLVAAMLVIWLVFS